MYSSRGSLTDYLQQRPFEAAVPLPTLKLEWAWAWAWARPRRPWPKVGLSLQKHPKLPSVKFSMAKVQCFYDKDLNEQNCHGR